MIGGCRRVYEGAKNGMRDAEYGMGDAEDGRREQKIRGGSRRWWEGAE